MVGCRPTFEAEFLPISATAPVPVAARFVTASLNYQIDFDQPLVFFIGPSPQVFGRAQGRQRFGALGIANGIQFSCSTTTGTFAPGDVVSYDATPPIIFGLVGGLPAEPFFNFPVDIV